VDKETLGSAEDTYNSLGAWPWARRRPSKRLSRLESTA